MAGHIFWRFYRSAGDKSNVYLSFDCENDRDCVNDAKWSGFESDVPILNRVSREIISRIDELEFPSELLMCPQEPIRRSF